MQVAVLMDSAPEERFHRATVEAVGHAAAALGLAPEVRVYRTDAVPFDERLTGVDGLVIGPGSPYRDEACVWSVIRRARERGVPLVGT